MVKLLCDESKSARPRVDWSIGESFKKSAITRPISFTEQSRNLKLSLRYGQTIPTFPTPPPKQTCTQKHQELFGTAFNTFLFYFLFPSHSWTISICICTNVREGGSERVCVSVCSINLLLSFTSKLTQLSFHCSTDHQQHIIILSARI